MSVWRHLSSRFEKVKEASLAHFGAFEEAK